MLQTELSCVVREARLVKVLTFEALFEKSLFFYNDETCHSMSLTYNSVTYRCGLIDFDSGAIWHRQIGYIGRFTDIMVKNTKNVRMCISQVGTNCKQEKTASLVPSD